MPKISGTGPRVILLTSSSVDGLRQLSSSVQAELSHQTLDTLSLRSLQNRLELSGQPGMLHWAVAGHDLNSIMAALQKGPLPQNQLKAIADFPPDRSKLLFAFSDQGSDLVGSWHELYRTNQSFASKLDQICRTANISFGLPLASALGLESNDAGLSVQSATTRLQSGISVSAAPRPAAPVENSGPRRGVLELAGP